MAEAHWRCASVQRHLWIVLLSIAISNLTCSARHLHHPLSAKASLLRFWRRELPNMTLPAFLLNRASPLNATSMAVFSALLERNDLASRITFFCTAADLLCGGRVYAVADQDREFANYHGKQFSSYESNDFKNYSRDDNVNSDSFSSYGPDTSAAQHNFVHYAENINAGHETFTSYGIDSDAGTRSFTSYANTANTIAQSFTSYGARSNTDNQSFTSYGDNANSASSEFSSYGGAANTIASAFKSYASQANIMNNSFSTYDVAGNGPHQDFASYASDSNVPLNQFHRYASDSNAASESFSSYADAANVGASSFNTYGDGGNAPTVTFTNYDGNASTYASDADADADSFINYAQSSHRPRVSFKLYGPTAVFKHYFNKDATSFSVYSTTTNKSKPFNGVVVEPGKFFRESKLKSGSEIALPDLNDYMAPRSFLPRSLADKFPVTSESLPGLLKLFQIPQNSSMETMMRATVYDCEREPAKGETKRCVTSVEGMVQFAKKILGPDMQVMTTASTRGSRHNVIMGAVSGVAGGGVTRSVSCHQSMFPFLVYYCHSVPQVRVYEADMLSSSSNSSSRGQDQDQEQNSNNIIINHGVGICHLDTSVWSPNHAAFRALGGKPGGIEVCHWIFEDDLIWVPSGSGSGSGAGHVGSG